MSREIRHSTQARLWFEPFRRQAGEGCPRCGQAKAYRLNDGRLRCPDCAYTYHEYSGRWINRGRLDLGAWFELLPLFVEGSRPGQAARVLKVNRDTVHKAYTTIRSSLLAEITDSSDVLSPSGDLVRFCPNLEDEGEQMLCQGCRAYVFALRFNGADRVEMAFMPGLAAREVLTMPLAKKEWRRLVITDAFNKYAGLVFACCPRGMKLFGGDFTPGQLPLEREKGFAAFADDWFAHQKFFSPEYYPLYLAETIFRYNYRGKRLAGLIAQSLCRFVPKPGQ